MKEETEDRSYTQPTRQTLIVIGLLILLVPLFRASLGVRAFLSAISVLLFLPVFGYQKPG